MMPLPNKYYRYVADYAIGYHNPNPLYEVYDYQIVREQPTDGSWKIYVFFDSDEDQSPFTCIGDANFYLTEADTEEAAIKLLSAVVSAETGMAAIMSLWERQSSYIRNYPEKLISIWKTIGREALTPHMNKIEKYLAQLPADTQANYRLFDIACEYYATVREIKAFWVTCEQKYSFLTSNTAKPKRTGVMLFHPKGQN